MSNEKILNFNLKRKHATSKPSAWVQAIKFLLCGIAIILFIIDIPFLLFTLLAGGIDHALKSWYNKLLFAASNLEAYHRKNKGA